MKRLKSILAILLCTAALMFAVFLIGRYGWKLGGFRACESAGIEQVNVEENQVRICGFYPGSFPQGFLGYHAEQMFRFMLPLMTPGKELTVTTYREGVSEGVAVRAFYQKLGFVPGRMTVEFGSKVQEFVMEVAKWQIS